MKKLLIVVLLSVFLTGCSKSDPVMSKFEKEMNTFCGNLYDIDASINSITNITTDEAGLKDATDTLIYNLELLDDEFKRFSNIDFPEEYDYLEALADEASDYMTEAVKSYQTTYEDNYTESMEEYARENYSRAYKRVQFVLDVLHGEDPNAE